jgi:hypothetical protein
MVSRNHFSQREVCHKSQERKKKVIAVKEVRSKEVDGSSASIGLLVSILVRYPEICTVSYTPDAKMLGFSFMVSRRLEDDEVQGFRSRALDSISVYLDLLKYTPLHALEFVASIPALPVELAPHSVNFFFGFDDSLSLFRLGFFLCIFNDVPCSILRNRDPCLCNPLSRKVSKISGYSCYGHIN